MTAARLRQLGVQRVAVVGCPGSGKSRLSRQLAELLDIPIVHLDDLYWHRGWGRTPEADWQQIVRAMTDDPQWLIDGNFLSTLELRAARAQVVVFLDLMPSRCLFNVLRRHVRRRLGERDSLPRRIREAGDRPSVPLWRWRFWHFVASFRRNTWPAMQAIFDRTGVDVVTLRSHAEVARFLEPSA
jgi:adenylate kinase family enzyme